MNYRIPAGVLPVEKVLDQCGVFCSHSVLERVEVYLELLEKWKRKINLTGIKSRHDILVKLFAESFLGAALVRQEDGPILDVGSGAGFPGMALKIFRPELGVYLLEPRKKRSSFLSTVGRELGLIGVEVICKRLEDCRPEDFPMSPKTLTCRAVGGLGKGIEQCLGILDDIEKLVLFTSRGRWTQQMQEFSGIDWGEQIEIPWSRQRVVICGRRHSYCST